MMKGCWIKHCKGKAVEKEEEINTWLADEEERGEIEKEKEEKEENKEMPVQMKLKKKT